MEELTTCMVYSEPIPDYGSMLASASAISGR